MPWGCLKRFARFAGERRFFRGPHDHRDTAGVAIRCFSDELPMRGALVRSRPEADCFPLFTFRPTRTDIWHVQLHAHETFTR
eukprot:7221749-Pyramimonas_sp.AAC.1